MARIAGPLVDSGIPCHQASLPCCQSAGQQENFLPKVGGPANVQWCVYITPHVTQKRHHHVGNILVLGQKWYGRSQIYHSPPPPPISKHCLTLLHDDIMSGSHGQCCRSLSCCRQYCRHGVIRLCPIPNKSLHQLLGRTRQPCIMATVW